MILVKVKSGSLTSLLALKYKQQNYKTKIIGKEFTDKRNLKTEESMLERTARSIQKLKRRDLVTPQAAVLSHAQLAHRLYSMAWSINIIVNIESLYLVI